MSASRALACIEVSFFNPEGYTDSKTARNQSLIKVIKVSLFGVFTLFTYLRDAGHLARWMINQHSWEHPGGPQHCGEIRAKPCAGGVPRAGHLLPTAHEAIRIPTAGMLIGAAEGLHVMIVSSYCKH